MSWPFKGTCFLRMQFEMGFSWKYWIDYVEIRMSSYGFLFAFELCTNLTPRRNKLYYASLSFWTISLFQLFLLIPLKSYDFRGPRFMYCLGSPLRFGLCIQNNFYYPFDCEYLKFDNAECRILLKTLCAFLIIKKM